MFSIRGRRGSRRRWAAVLIGAILSLALSLVWASFLILVVWGTGVSDSWPTWLHLVVMILGFVPILPSMALAWLVASRLTERPLWIPAALVSIVIYVVWSLSVAVMVPMD